MILRKEIHESMSPFEIARFKFPPTVTVDVERSFSSFKTLLADNRLSYTTENIKTLVTRCNAETVNIFSS